MARPKSEDKRNAILAAATRVFSEHGLNAPTHIISFKAGIAEGTLFTYFKTKDDLLNNLYCDIKLDLAAAMMSGFPRKKSIRSRLEHVWNSYIDWGINNTQQQQLLQQLQLWAGLTKESKQAGLAPFLEIQSMMEEAEKLHIVKPLPSLLIQAAFTAVADTVMTLARQDPKNAAAYRASGFPLIWSGIARK